MDRHRPKTNWYIYCAAFSTTVVAFATGGCWTWTSPILPKLNMSAQDTNPIGRPITMTESTWIVSIFNFGLIFGSPIYFVLSKFVTKKTTLLFVGCPLILAHTALIFANEVIYFLIARLLMGIACGAMWCVLPTFLAEMAEDRNRGVVGILAGIMSASGSLLTYVVGPYVSIKLFSTVNLIPVFIFFVLFSAFVPDNPYDLILKNKISQAEKSLSRLRRSSNVQKELAYMSSCVQNSTNKGFIDLFKESGLRKALSICVILMAIQQLSGVSVVISYTQTIFDLSGTSIPSDISAISVGIISLTSSLIGSGLIDMMGRRILVITGSTLASVSLFTLTVYFYLLTTHIDVSGIFWLPISSVIFFMFAFNFGLGILPWIILGEMFPSTVKPAASTIVSLTNYCLSFIVTMCYPYLVNLTSMSGTFLIFSIIMALAACFCYFKLPETKGKSFEEIERMLNK